MRSSPEPCAPRLISRVAAIETVSRRMLESGLVVAGETDRWFVCALLGVRTVGLRIRAGVGAVSTRVASQLGVGPSTRCTRIRKLVRREAVRARAAIPREEAEALADKIDRLVDLVFTGEVLVRDIAFERTDPKPYADAFQRTVFGSMDRPLDEQ